MFSFGQSSKNKQGSSISTVSQAPNIAPTKVNDALSRLASGAPDTKVHTKELDMSDMSESVRKKIQARQAQEQARIDAKLANHLLEAEQKEKDQLERDDVKARLQAKLVIWSGNPKTGSLKNIRAMISTMDTIMWENSGWKTVGMGDLVQPSRVKRAYYKAIRIAHPDRVQTGTVEAQYIASWMLDMLKLSWEQFKQKEM